MKRLQINSIQFVLVFVLIILGSVFSQVSNDYVQKHYNYFPVFFTQLLLFMIGGFILSLPKLSRLSKFKIQIRFCIFECILIAALVLVFYFYPKILLLRVLGFAIGFFAINCIKPSADKEASI